MRRLFTMILGTTLLAGSLAPTAMAQDAPETADTVFGGFRADLAADLVETRARLTLASKQVRDPDWFIVETPDSGPVGIRRSELALHADLLADPDFIERSLVLDDPVNAWDESFTMTLSYLRDLGGDPHETAEALARELVQTETEKQDMLRPERQWLRRDRDELIAAIEAYDAFVADIGIAPAAVAAADIRPAPVPRAETPLELVLTFRDELVADRARVAERMADCRTAIDDDEVAALGTDEFYKLRPERGLSDVVAFELPTLAEYAAFPMHLRDDDDAWDSFDTIFAPDVARRTDLAGAMLLFSFWQDWPGDLAAGADEMWPVERRTPKADRSRCRPVLELLRPERDRLDAAITTLDEYLALDAPEPAVVPEATPEPELDETPAPNPFADL